MEGFIFFNLVTYVFAFGASESDANSLETAATVSKSKPVLINSLHITGHFST